MNIKRIAILTLLVFGSLSLIYNVYTFVVSRGVSLQEKVAIAREYQLQKTDSAKQSFALEYSKLQQGGLIDVSRSSARSREYSLTDGDSRCAFWLSYSVTYFGRAVDVIGRIADRIGSSDPETIATNTTEDERREIDGYFSAADQMGSNYFECMGLD